jgi:hypothetical protein
LIGEKMTVLVDEIGVARSHREAPEIDGVVHVSETLSVATFVEVEIADALGPDLVATGANHDANHDENELVDDAS